MKSATNDFANDILNQVFDGVQKSENADMVNTMLDKFELNWKVEKLPLLLPNQKDSGFFGIVRTDTQKTFSTCKDGYQEFQNSELAEMLIRISEKTGYAIHKGGMFNDGAKVYLQLTSPNNIQNIGANNDKVNGYLTGINSHDGTTSLKWGETNITISCLNTFFYAMKQLKSSSRHTSTLHAKVESAIREVNHLVNTEKSLFEEFIKLSEIPVTQKDIAKIVRNVTDVDTSLTRAELEEKYTTYAINRTSELLQAIAKETTQKGQTLWGLFSGVTQYTNYNLTNPKRENAKLESIYTGNAFKINNDAYHEIKKIAELA